MPGAFRSPGERRLLEELPDYPRWRTADGVSERAFVRELFDTFDATLSRTDEPMRAKRHGETNTEYLRTAGGRLFPVPDTVRSRAYGGPHD